MGLLGPEPTIQLTQAWVDLGKQIVSRNGDICSTIHPETFPFPISICPPPHPTFSSAPFTHPPPHIHTDLPAPSFLSRLLEHSHCHLLWLSGHTEWCIMFCKSQKETCTARTRGVTWVEQEAQGSHFQVLPGGGNTAGFACPVPSPVDQGMLSCQSSALWWKPSSDVTMSHDMMTSPHHDQGSMLHAWPDH